MSYFFSPTPNRDEPKYPSAEEVLALFERAGIAFPNWSTARMKTALEKSDFVLCVWNQGSLVGFARGLTDGVWSGWLSQIAVDPIFQKNGLGRRMADQIIEYLGEEVSLATHSAEKAVGFYSALGFEQYTNVYRIKRKK